MTDTPHTEAEELAAIEALHEKDMDAARTCDAETLRSLWTEDIVVMPPAGDMVVGEDANYAALLRQLDTLRDTVITEYRLEFQEVRIVGEFAFEWGTYRGASRPRAGGAEKRQSGKIMRVLRRTAPGQWKVARSIWTADKRE